MPTNPAVQTGNPSDAGASRSPDGSSKATTGLSIVLSVLVAAAVLLGLVYVLVIRPQYGAITVEMADADASEVKVAFQMGEELHVACAEDGWKMRLKEGKWSVKIFGDASNSYRLDKERLTLLGSTEETVRVMRSQKEAAVAITSVALKPAPPATDPLLATLRDFEAGISSLACSSESESLASSSYDGTTKLWSTKTGKLLATFGGHSNRPVWSLAISPDGETLATAGGDGKILLWNVTTQSFLRVFKDNDIPDYQKTLDLGAHDLSNICFSPDGQTLAVCGMKYDSVNLWDLETGSLVRSLELKETGGLTPTRIAFGPQGKRLAVSGHWNHAQGRLTMLDVDSGAVLWTTTMGKWMPTVAFSPDGKMLATGNASDRWARVFLLDATDGQLIDKLDGYHDTRVWSIAFSPDGKTLASCCRKIRIWDVASRNRLATFTGHEGLSTDLVFSADGRALASSSTDLDIKIWDVPAVIAASRQKEQEEERQSLAEIPLEPTTTSVVQSPALIHDGFDGKLEQDWEILHSDPSHVSFTKNPGTLTITSQQGAFGSEHTNHKNVFLLDNPLADGDDFTITTCLVAFRPLDAWNGASLFCFDDVDNFVKLGYHAVAPNERRIGIGFEHQGVRSKTEHYLTFRSKVERLWLRMTKRGRRYVGSFSLDGKSFRSIGELTWGSGAPKKLGLCSQNGAKSDAPSVDASFDFFEMRKASPVEQTPDRYTVVEEDVVELLKFIQELQRFRPKSQEEYREHQLRSTKAIKLAARKILDSETDDKSEAVQTARLVLLEDRVRSLRNASLVEKQEVLRELEAILTLKASSSLSSRDLNLAMSVARTLEYDDQNELAAEACENFARLFAGSSDEKLSQTARMLEMSAKRLRLIGNEMELEGALLDGGEFDWSAYRGKVVLVDFWATWCGPCRAEAPNVRRHYDLYHDLGFEVVGISLDTKKDALGEYVKKEEIPWVNLYQDGAGWKHPMAVKYGVQAIPTVFLVDRDGKVVSLRARGAELGKQLEKLFGLDTQLAITCAAEGKWDKVADEMKRHLAVDPRYPQYYWALAAAQLNNADTKAFQETCTMAWERYRNGHVWERMRLATLCSLANNSGIDVERIDQLATEALEESADSTTNNNKMKLAKLMAQYRSVDYEQCMEGGFAGGDPLQESIVHLIKAMAAKQLDRNDEAAKLFASGSKIVKEKLSDYQGKQLQDWMPAHWICCAVAEVIHSEARETLEK